MKIFGHPIHVMLIHFPAALFPMDFVCSLLGYLYQDSSFLQGSFLAITGGAVLGSMAIITGGFDLVSMVNENSPAVKKALIHGSINSTVVIAYIVLAFIAFKKYPLVEYDAISKILFKGGLVTLMILGNYLGGSLVLKDKVGVEK